MPLVVVDNGNKPIREITKGAMQRRFSYPEEVALVESSDTLVQVIRSRLFNVPKVELDFPDTIEGIGYVVNHLTTIADPNDPLKKIIEPADASTRLGQLLSDGTPDEQ